ncbi:MAG: SufS family cysteine desulfurase [Proteobacteria bacterium]|nr:SufS family cysteine desulfurase [Pseudomonadota bacterium]
MTIEPSVTRASGRISVDQLAAADHSVIADSVRAEFPVLKRLIHGKKLVYLDSAATTLKPARVIEAVTRYYREGTANIHRGVHFLSEEATSLYETVRGTAQGFVNAREEREIVFTSGTTASINLVARSFVRPMLKSGDEILITALEHHANIVPWQMLCEETGAKLVVAAVNDDGELLMADFKNKISARTKFMSVIWVSNAIGTINPIQEMVAAAKSAGVPILVDAAQNIAHHPIDVQTLDPDFLVFSAHKLFGPTGVGVLYGKIGHLEKMPPITGGGDMIKSVSFEKTVFAQAPARFEAGTPDIAGVIGFGEAMRFVTDDVGFDFIVNHERKLFQAAEKSLAEVDGLRVIGRAKHKVPVFSLVLDGIHPHDLGTIMDQHGVAVRTGHHCAQPLMTRFGIAATARASFSIYNTLDDVKSLVHSLWQAKELFA